MATTNLQMSPQVEQIHGQIRDHFRALAYMNSLGNKKLELFDLGAGASEPIAEDDVHLASDSSQENAHLACPLELSNQELINAGMKTMIRPKQVVHQTIEVGTPTATTLNGQTEQRGRIVNELDSIQFLIKKASQLVKEIGRQVSLPHDQIVNPNNKEIKDIPGLAAPAPTRRLLYVRTGEHFD